MVLGLLLVVLLLVLLLLFSLLLVLVVLLLMLLLCLLLEVLVVLLLGQVVWQVLLHQVLVLLAQLAKVLLPLLVLLVLWAVVLLLLLAVLAEALPLELWTWVQWVALSLAHGGVPPTHFLPATQGQLAAVVVLQLGSSSPGPLAWAFACGALAVEVGNPSCLPYMALWLLLLLLLLAWDWEVQSDWKCHCCTGHAGPAPYSPLALLGCSWLLLWVAGPLPGPAQRALLSLLAVLAVAPLG